MVARVEPSYNVVSLFTTLKGQPSASTAAVDAIIDQVRKINAAASNARLQGASMATEAWFSQANPETEWVRIGDIDAKSMRSRFSTDGEYAVFANFLKSSDQDRRMEKTSVESMVSGSIMKYNIDLQTSYYSDKARDGGSIEVRDLIARGNDVGSVAYALARYNLYSTLLKEGNRFIKEKTLELSSLQDEGKKKVINEDLEMANQMICGKQEFVDNFQTYLDYATWSWSAGSYNLSGALYKKNEDGTYSPDAFEITLKGGNAVYWKHDGNGVALRSNPFGTEYFEEDLLYMDNFYKKNSYQSFDDRFAFRREHYPYRVVRDGYVMYSNKPTEDSVKI